MGADQRADPRPAADHGPGRLSRPRRSRLPPARRQQITTENLQSIRHLAHVDRQPHHDNTRNARFFIGVVNAAEMGILSAGQHLPAGVPCNCSQPVKAKEGVELGDRLPGTSGPPVSSQAAAWSADPADPCISDSPAWPAYSSETLADTSCPLVGSEVSLNTGPSLGS